MSFLLFDCYRVLLIEPSVAPVTMSSNPSSGPKVSVVIHNNPIWVPPQDHISSYTREILYTTPSGYALNGSIVVTIKNQPFTAYTDKNNNTINRYYTVFLKALSHDLPWGNDLTPWLVLYQSNSVNTVLTFTYDNMENSDLHHLYVVWEETAIDFRIQAIVEHFYRGERPYSDDVFKGECSAFADFSITLPKSTDKAGVSKSNIQPSSVVPSTFVQSNPSPQRPWQSDISLRVIVAVCLITISIAIVSCLTNNKKPNSCNYHSIKLL